MRALLFDMLNNETTKKLTTGELLFARKDLRQAIECQELMARGGFRTPKLGQYVDELLAVAQELKRRGI